LTDAGLLERVHERLGGTPSLQQPLEFAQHDMELAV
jgi:hypothetical protein